MSEDAKKEHFYLLVPGSPNSLAVIRWVVTRLAKAAGLSDDEVDQIEIAVDEACTNVIDHAYGALATKPPIVLEMQAGEGQFVVDVIDTGKSFEFDEYKQPKFPDHWNEGNVRGVGLYLIHQCMDKVEYDKVSGDKNRMRLIKHRSPPGEPQPA